MKRMLRDVIPRIFVIVSLLLLVFVSLFIIVGIESQESTSDMILQGSLGLLLFLIALILMDAVLRTSKR